MDDLKIWQTKLAARLHDPIEKSLVLMRTAEGHEGGTSAELRALLGLDGLPTELWTAVKQADHWASAADRAAFPNRNSDGRYPRWQQVRFDQKPVIIHPLTGEAFDIGTLTEVTPEQAKEAALQHLKGLIHENERKTALAFWRFGPEIGDDSLKSLWAQLPADTRVPDHTIFDHLDLTAALATCFAAGDQPALLAVSIGPVQDFIAASRSTSDLWAGSHLLSRLSWEAMKVVCEELGPEAILFPRLRGVPQVDLWLQETCGLRADLFSSCTWRKVANDANPLFAAALPNRFTAMVPASRARELAEKIEAQLRKWMVTQGETTFRRLVQEAGLEDDPDYYGYQQIREQLKDFPEVFWVAVPWSLVDTDNEGWVDSNLPKLTAAMQPFFASDTPGYLGTRAWQLISGGIQLEEGWFWRPNPGTLYPALHELLERALAAVKAVRPFSQSVQYGWRDSLSGDAEWLTTDRAQLDLAPGQRRDTIWTRVANKRKRWVKEGEHLSVLSAIKRLWPTLFVEELNRTLDLSFSRFVVSTHTMALATSLTKALEENRPISAELAESLRSDSAQRVAMPRKLARALSEHKTDGDLLSRLPGWFDQMRESKNEADQQRAERLLKDFLGGRPETYYGMLLMDGDRMGAWLSAAREVTLEHRSRFHPQIQAGLQQLHEDPNFTAYAAEKRAPSPSRHMAISEALNNFALQLAPEVIEGHYNGRVLYAGGDDLMAMLPVSDLLSAMAAARAAYSGVDPRTVGCTDMDLGFSRQANGFVQFRGELLRLMGEKATASCGAVIAHHQAPLGAVLRQLRAAENRAKESGRDAFAITVIKRSGGALHLVARWGKALELLNRLRALLAEPAVSRRAVYNSAQWLKDLPAPEDHRHLAATLLSYQFKRQISGSKKTLCDYDIDHLCSELVAQAIEHVEPDQQLKWLGNFLSVAEFMARETRASQIELNANAREVSA